MKVIAVDFDGVIAKFDEWRGEDHFGEPIQGVREAMIELKKRGFKIVVYTCRACIEKIRAYLEENEIPYDFINENPYEPEGVHPRKLYADLYIDDRAINFKDWESTLKAIDNWFAMVK